MTNDFFEFCQKVSFISYIRNVRMVHGQCTNGTWAMYEWYKANVRIVHGQCIKSKWPFYTI